jgi:Nif-specific regulatory protein
MYLNEVGNLGPAIQVKLLRLLQEREFERLGSSLTRHANVRILAASEKDLDSMVAERKLRQDLYFCLAGFPIYLPPLRERKDDILLLANALAEKHGRRLDRPVKRISSTAIDMLLSYHWPGNVRELDTSMEHAVRMATEGVIHGRHLPPTLQKPGRDDAPVPGSLSAQVEMLERDMLMDALKRENGNMSAAARELGITPRMVRYKVKKLAIDLEAYGNPAAKIERDNGKEAMQ